MTLLRRSLGAKFLLLFALIPMLILSACGSSTSSFQQQWYSYTSTSTDNGWEQTRSRGPATW